MAFADGAGLVMHEILRSRRYIVVEAFGLHPGRERPWHVVTFSGLTAVTVILPQP